MNRLTEKVKNINDYIKLPTKDKQEFINKLGVLEDLLEVVVGLMRKGECRVMLNADICIEEYYKNFEKWLEDFGRVLYDNFGLKVTYDKEKRTVTLSEEIQGVRK